MFGLVSALSWGIGDFAGGLASRFGSVALAMLVSQTFGAVTAMAALRWSTEVLPPNEALFWAAAAGLAGIGGLACFYRALSGGSMALIAPLAGLIGAAVPAAVAIVGGEQVSPLRSIGLVTALLAIVLISVPRGTRGSATRVLSGREALLATAGGLGFAAFFLFLDRSAATGGEAWWPLLVVRLVGLAAVIAAVVVLSAVSRGGKARRRPADLLGLNRLRLSAQSAGWLTIAPVFLLAGAGDMGGNVFFLFANRHDTLAVAAVLSSLYPIVTALLAAAFLHERLGRPQIVGVALAVAAAALIGVG